MGFIPRSEVNRDRLRDEAVSLRGSVEDMKTFGETMKIIKALDDPSDNDFVYVQGGRMLLNRVVLRNDSKNLDDGLRSQLGVTD
jgi:hypothetical protein